MKYPTVLSCIILTALWIPSIGQYTQSKTHYIVSVQRQAFQDLRKLDRMTVLVDSLNATLEKYGLLVDQKDFIITRQDSIISEKSKQFDLSNEVINSKDTQLTIVTKELNKKSGWNTFFKGTTAGLLIYIIIRSATQ